MVKAGEKEKLNVRVCEFEGDEMNRATSLDAADSTWSLNLFPPRPLFPISNCLFLPWQPRVERVFLCDWTVSIVSWILTDSNFIITLISSAETCPSFSLYLWRKPRKFDEWNFIRIQWSVSKRKPIDLSKDGDVKNRVNSIPKFTTNVWDTGTWSQAIFFFFFLIEEHDAMFIERKTIKISITIVPFKWLMKI